MPRQISPQIIKHGQFAENELVFMMGEELKKPLTNIKLLAENQSDTSTIGLEAHRALRTIDNIILFQQLSSDQLALSLEPIHIGSTLSSVATQLQPFSMEFGCETEVFIQSGINTVDTDREVLKSGLESLWQAMLGMTERPSTLSWHVYKSPKGIRVALLNNSVDLSKVSFSKNTYSAGSSRQPFAGVAGPATDLITASGLFSLLGSSLTKIKKGSQQGLAVTLRTSTQLALI
jgi:hypothetical protein